jgi:hypothetical protein
MRLLGLSSNNHERENMAGEILNGLFDSLPDHKKGMPGDGVKSLKEQVNSLSSGLASWRSDMERAAELCGRRDDEYPMQAIERFTRTSKESLYRCLDSARLAKARLAKGYMPDVEQGLSDIIAICRSALNLPNSPFRKPAADIDLDSRQE